MLARLRSTWHWTAGLAILVPSLLLLLSLSLFAPLSRYERLARALFGLALRAFGMRLRVIGLEQLDPAKGYVYMANHLNWLEPFILAVSVPHWIVGVEKAENFKIPIYGQTIRAWGHISIDRANLTAAIASLQRAREVLASGVSIVILPEGTRSRNGALQPFKKGAFHVALDAGATVVPVAFRGLFDFYRTGSGLIRPGVVEVVFTPPVEASDYDKERLGELSDRVRSQIASALAEGSQASRAIAGAETNASTP